MFKWFKKAPTLLTLDNWRLWNPDNQWVAREIVEAWEAEGLPYPRANGCSRCGSRDSIHCTNYMASGGMCPLCESCWTELGTAEARRPYYRSLWFRWDMPYRYNGTPYGHWSIDESPFERGGYRARWEEIEEGLRLEEAGLSVT